MSVNDVKIISGGQTGVDRAALDAALDNAVACGGLCPAGRRAEDGPIPDRYPLTELQTADYRERTIKNLMQADGTVIIYFSRPTGGTKLTLDSCIKYLRPYVKIDADRLSETEAAQKIAEFIDRFDIGTLNVAGPRGSGHPDAYRYAYDVISGLLKPREYH